MEVGRAIPKLIDNRPDKYVCSMEVDVHSVVPKAGMWFCN